MSVKILLICAVAIVNFINANPIPAVQCVGLYEVWNECGPACPKTCDNFQDNIMCIESCVPSCVCSDGAVRNRWGNCVPEKKCALENRARALHPEHTRVINYPSRSKREIPTKSFSQSEN